VEQCDDALLNEREMFWIAYYDSYKNGYNLTIGGEGKRKYSDNEILSLWNDGYGVLYIAEILGSDRHVIRDRLEAIGISIADRRKRAADERRVNCVKDIERLWEDGYSVSEIKQQTGASLQAIHYNLQNMGVTKNDMTKRSMDRRRYTKANDMLNLWQDGMSISEIGRIVHSNFVTVHRILLDMGIDDKDIEHRTLERRQCRNDTVPVQQFDCNGNMLNEYVSVNAAIKSTGIKNIVYCCQGKRKSAGGYIWKYAKRDKECDIC
jgi:hypothetical protein